MCGIAGSEDLNRLEQIVEDLEHRGSSMKIDEGCNYGHVLHSVVGHVEQPLENEGVLTANCEIYNWKELAQKHSETVDNDADLLIKLLDSLGVEKTLNQIDGVYAFAFRKNNVTFLARDILGVKPLWYSTDPFEFASEKQALPADANPRELHPREILKYDHGSGEVSRIEREFFEVNVDETMDFNEAVSKTKELLIEAVRKRIPDTEFGVLLSGGVDSTTLAQIAKNMGESFECYSSGTQPGNTDPPRDKKQAEFAAEKLNLDLHYRDVDLEEIEDTIPTIVDWISSTSTVKTGVALPMHFSLQGDEKVIFSGLGSEQLFAGYHRHQRDLNDECLSGLRQIWHNDLYRDDVITMRNGYELRLPFLDQDLVKFSLKIPEKYKKDEKFRKKVLRKVASELGVPEEIAYRKKVAAQYGSNFDKAISKLASQHDFNHKQQYLNSYRDQPNKVLAALSSGGKDSNAAIYRMLRRNNRIEVLANFQSDEEYPMMFDPKDSSIVERQAKTIGAGFEVFKTSGDPQDEEKDLVIGMRNLREKHGIEGIVSGALFSNYQRNRLERAAESAGLKVFAPLWSEDPENYMRWLVREGFTIRISEVKGRGLEDDWVGKTLDSEKVEELIELSQEYGFNPAGEGGSYETVLEGFPADLDSYLN